MGGWRHSSTNQQPNGPRDKEPRTGVLSQNNEHCSRSGSIDNDEDGGNRDNGNVCERGTGSLFGSHVGDKESLDKRRRFVKEGRKKGRRMEKVKVKKKTLNKGRQNGRRQLMPVKGQRRRCVKEDERGRQMTRYKDGRCFNFFEETEMETTQSLVLIFNLVLFSFVFFYVLFLISYLLSTSICWSF